MKRWTNAVLAVALLSAFATVAVAETRAKAKGITFKPAKSTPGDDYTVAGVPDGVTVYVSKSTTLSQADVKDAAYVTDGQEKDGLLIRFTDRAVSQMGDADRLATFIDGELKIVSTLEGLREQGHASILGLTPFQVNEILRRVRADGSSFGGPVIDLVPATSSVHPGETIAIDVFGRNLTNVRAYQIMVDAHGGEAGTLRKGGLKLDESRSDYLLYGTQTMKMLDEAGGRLAAFRMKGGSDAGGAAYLGTIMFKASDDAAGTFDFLVRLGGESIVKDGGGKNLAFRVGRTSIGVR